MTWYPKARTLSISLAVVLGFAVPQFGDSAHDDVARFAATAEELGAESLWVGDRLLAATRPAVGLDWVERLLVR
jgi:alkanesulfonate monooxygenase SsuD/methylene tetrahydromethanopterin reductase-like flavin-dependent oxidoreductase (luciferase family)